MRDGHSVVGVECVRVENEIYGKLKTGRMHT